MKDVARPAAFALLVHVMACAARPSPAAPPPSAPITLPPALAATKDEQPYAERVLAAVVAREWSIAEQLLARPPAYDRPCADASLRTSRAPDGTRTLWAPRGWVRVDAEEHVVERGAAHGCLEHVEPGLTVTFEGDTLHVEALVHGSTVHARATPAQPVGALAVSPWWVIARDGEDGFAAVHRGLGSWAQMPPRTEGLPPPKQIATGRFFVTESARGLALHRDNIQPIPVAGCVGTLVGAAALSDDLVAIQVENAPVVAETWLCFVDATGQSRKPINLGSAMCGMRGPVPCAWRIHGAAAGVIGFGSMRGELLFVDDRGKVLPLELPPGVHTEGAGPSGLVDCREGLCASVMGAGGEGVTLALSRDRVRMVTRPATPVPPLAWCVREGLPVPAKLCPP